ncbi:MAG: hypothetical protein HZY76_15515 [Anaerolineae bacterium]|nr:MAG: hypothetical protein HZY76_15515 [Anaerolineae bacterium]
MGWSVLVALVVALACLVVGHLVVGILVLVDRLVLVALVVGRLVVALVVALLVESAPLVVGHQLGLVGLVAALVALVVVAQLVVVALTRLVVVATVELRRHTHGRPGDAPDSSNHYGVAMTAYTGPPTVNASYPTVYDPGLGAPYGPLHRYPYADAWLGTSVATERDADLLPDADGWTNIDPSNNFSNRDNYDDGVNTGAINLVHCTPTTVTFVVNVQSLATRTRYVNIWFDWDAMETGAIRPTAAPALARRPNGPCRTTRSPWARRPYADHSGIPGVRSARPCPLDAHHPE